MTQDPNLSRTFTKPLFGPLPPIRAEYKAPIEMCLDLLGIDLRLLHRDFLRLPTTSDPNFRIFKVSLSQYCGFVTFSEYLILRAVSTFEKFSFKYQKHTYLILSSMTPDNTAITLSSWIKFAPFLELADPLSSVAIFQALSSLESLPVIRYSVFGDYISTLSEFYRDHPLTPRQILYLDTSFAMYFDENKFGHRGKLVLSSETLLFQPSLLDTQIVKCSIDDIASVQPTVFPSHEMQGFVITTLAGDKLSFGIQDVPEVYTNCEILVVFLIEIVECFSLFRKHQEHCEMMNDKDDILGHSGFSNDSKNLESELAKESISGVSDIKTKNSLSRFQVLLSPIPLSVFRAHLSHNLIRAKSIHQLTTVLPPQLLWFSHPHSINEDTIIPDIPITFVFLPMLAAYYGCEQLIPIVNLFLEASLNTSESPKNENTPKNLQSLDNSSANSTDDPQQDIISDILDSNLPGNGNTPSPSETPVSSLKHDEMSESSPEVINTIPNQDRSETQPTDQPTERTTFSSFKHLVRRSLSPSSREKIVSNDQLLPNFPSTRKASKSTELPRNISSTPTPDSESGSPDSVDTVDTISTKKLDISDRPRGMSDPGELPISTLPRPEFQEDSQTDVILPSTSSSVSSAASTNNQKSTILNDGTTKQNITSAAENKYTDGQSPQNLHRLKRTSSYTEIPKIEGLDADIDTNSPMISLAYKTDSASMVLPTSVVLPPETTKTLSSVDRKSLELLRELTQELTLLYSLLSPFGVFFAHLADAYFWQNVASSSLLAVVLIWIVIYDVGLYFIPLLFLSFLFILGSLRVALYIQPSLEKTHFPQASNLEKQILKSKPSLLISTLDYFLNTVRYANEFFQKIYYLYKWKDFAASKAYAITLLVIIFVTSVFSFRFILVALIIFFFFKPLYFPVLMLPLHTLRSTLDIWMDLNPRS